MPPLLKILDLQVQFVGPQGKRIHAVNGVNLEMQSGEVLGLLGESGSGKSTVARTLLRLLPKRAQATARSLEFEGLDLLALTEIKLEKVRGARITMISQDPGLALNPVRKVGDQIAEVIRAHRDWSWRRCQKEAEALLERVHLNDPDRRMYEAYPHQLSGGQQQRVAIAQAVSCQPALVIADEPTASLDSSLEREILVLLGELKADQNMSLLLITHNPAILRGMASRVAVMYGGRVVEEGSLDRVFQEPHHPYTKALLACVPPAPGERVLMPGMRLPTIEGSSPDSEAVPAGCSFAPRCAQRMQKCEVHHPAPVQTEDIRQVECFLYGT
jgi:oligopeptide/dipeptide ABC transporter ATP-binding protein